MLFYWAAAASLEAPPQLRAFPVGDWERDKLLYMQLLTINYELFGQII